MPAVPRAALTLPRRGKQRRPRRPSPVSHAHTAPNLPRDGPFARTGCLTVAQKSKPAPIRPTPKTQHTTRRNNIGHF